MQALETLFSNTAPQLAMIEEAGSDAPQATVPAPGAPAEHAESAPAAPPAPPAPAQPAPQNDVAAQAPRSDSASSWSWNNQPAAPPAPAYAPPPAQAPAPAPVAASQGTAQEPGEPATAGSYPEPTPLPTGEGSYVTPLVRKLAAEHSVPLESISGTGVGGRIRKQDVL